MQELINYLVKHEKLTEANETISGLINADPYASSPSLHGYACWLCAELFANEKRPLAKERYLKRATVHFEQYLTLLAGDCFDLVFVRAYVTLLLNSEKEQEARDLLEKLLEERPQIFDLHLDHFHLLVSNFNSDRAAIRHRVEGLCQLSYEFGINIPTDISLYVKRLLLNKQMKLDEYAPYLYLYSYMIFLQVSRLPQNKCFNYLSELLSLKLQFDFCQMDSEWASLTRIFGPIIKRIYT